MDPAAPHRRRFDLVAYLKLFRFPLVFTAIADSMAGYFRGDSGNPLRADTVVMLPLLALSSAGLYMFGMALNDIADRHRDQEIAPSRVLPSGRISSRNAVLAALLVLLMSLTALVFADRRHWPNPGHTCNTAAQRFVVWGLLVIAIVAYNYVLKIPPTMGLVRALNVVLGVSAVRDICDSHEHFYAAINCLPIFAYVTALTYVSTLEEGEVNRRKLWIGATAMIIPALLAGSWTQVHWFALRAIRRSDGQGLDLGNAASSFDFPWAGVAAGGMLAFWIFRRARDARDRKGIMMLVRDGVCGIILLDAAVLLSELDYAQGAIVASLLIPAVLSLVIFKRLA